MNDKLSSPIESFALSPLIAVLPSRGSLTRLDSLLSSLYARQEKVETMRGHALDKESERRLSVEGVMLHQILDWLAGRAEEEG